MFEDETFDSILNYLSEVDLSTLLPVSILAVPIVLVIVASLGLLLLLCRCYKTGSVFLVIALLLNVYTQSIPLNPLSSAGVSDFKPAGTIRILEYNICGKKEYAERHEQQEFLDYVLSFDADILFLPENHTGTAPMLDSALLVNYPYAMHLTEGADPWWEHAIYSRFPLSEYRKPIFSRERFWTEHPSADSVLCQMQDTHIYDDVVTADIYGRKVTLCYVHLHSNQFDQAKVVGTRRRQKAHSIIERIRFSYQYRDTEAHTLADTLSAYAEQPMLICGDFNDLSGSHVLRLFQNSFSLQDAWWERGLGFGFTFDDQHLLLRLDHILYSEPLKLQGVSVKKADYSDHLPLVADFILSD